MANDINIGTSVTYSIGVMRCEGIVREVYGNRAIIQPIGTRDTLSFPLSDLARWKAPYPPFEAGHGRPDLERLYEVAHALRRGDDPNEVLRNVEAYLTHRRPDVQS